MTKPDYRSKSELPQRITDPNVVPGPAGTPPVDLLARIAHVARVAHAVKTWALAEPTETTIDESGAIVPQPPVIIDTDCFYDPDDMISLTVAALAVEHLTVITSDETGGRRARGARRFLDLIGRPDAVVVAGLDLGDDRRFLMDDLIDGVAEQPADVVDAVARACATTCERVIWVGQGPMSNLARILTTQPQLAERLNVIQQGGWLDEYRDPSRASHNLRLDPTAAGLAIRAAFEPQLLLSDWTNTDELSITRESGLFQMLSAPGVPDWARWVAVNLVRWFERGKPSRMHDPLALSVALGLEFVRFADVRVRIEADARMYRDRRGRIVRAATGVDYAGFMPWLSAVIAGGLGQIEPQPAQAMRGA
jgi:inosine-uridine nucleoside N-ribohydrolase